MKVKAHCPAYYMMVWHSLICQVHVLLQIRKAKWLLKSASASSASLKLKEWKPKCSTYTLKVPFPLVLWLYFQMLFFGYIRFAWNWIFRTSLLNYIHTCSSCTAAWQNQFCYLWQNILQEKCIFSTWGNLRVRLFLSTSWCISLYHEWPKATSDGEMHQRVLRKSLNPRIASCGRGIL